MSPENRPILISSLAKELGIGKTRIYSDIRNGYELQWPTLRRTSLAHYLAWHQELGKVKGAQAQADQSRLEHELCRLR